MKFKVGDKIIRNKTCPQLMYKELRCDTIYTIYTIREVGEHTYVYELMEIRRNRIATVFSQENIDKYFDFFDNSYARSLKIKKLKETYESRKTNS